MEGVQVNKLINCREHSVTGPVRDCADCQFRERLAIALFNKYAWANSEPDADARRWEVEDDCPEWMRDDYRYLAEAAIEHLAKEMA